MTNTDTNWHIIKVAPSKTLPIHGELMGHGFDVWTPFETKHQALTAQDRKKRLRRKPFAYPIFGALGFMFVRVVTAEQALRLHTIVEKHRFIHGVVLSPIESALGPQWYALSDLAIEAMRERHGRSYDPKRDAMKNNTRLYGQTAVEIPEFEEFEIVRFVTGAMVGIDFKVLGSIAEKVMIEPVENGWISKVEADAVDLKRKVA